MAITKERGRFRYDFWLDNTRYRDYCVDLDGKDVATKAEARKAEARAKVAAETARRSATEVVTAPGSYPLGEAMAAWLASKAGTANEINNAIYAAEILEYFGAATPLDDIREANPRDKSARTITTYIAFSRAQTRMVYLGKGRTRAALEERGVDIKTLYRPARSGAKRADSTTNHYLNAVRGTLRLAYDTIDPATGQRMLRYLPRVPKLKVAEQLPKPIADDALSWMIDDPKTPPHLAEAVYLIRNMGFRKAEVFSRTIDHVADHLRGIWLDADETKGKKPELVEANAAVWLYIQRLVAQAKARGVVHLITYQRPGSTDWLPVKNPRRSFRTALKRVGLAGQHVFHNTKASFVTAVAGKKSGAMTQALARHSSFATTQRYIRLADVERREAVEAITFTVRKA